MKHDFESAFPHILVSPLDSPLLGFHWKATYYAKQFLHFGLRTAPYMLNLLAEVFHWFVECELKPEGQEIKIIHYVEDFLPVLPPGYNLTRYSTKFSSLCEVVGLAIKGSKNE